MHRHSFATRTPAPAPSQLLRGEAMAYAPANGFPARAGGGSDSMEMDSWRPARFGGTDTDGDFVEGGPV